MIKWILAITLLSTTAFLAIILFSADAYSHGNQAHSTLGDKNNINNCNPVLKCEARVKEIVVYKDKIVEVEKPVYKDKIVYENKIVYKDRVIKEIRKEKAPKNTISVLVGATASKLKTKETKTTYEANTEYEADIGLMYQRTFSSTVLSIAATVQGSALMGFGLDF